MKKNDGMNYAPKGRSKKVVKEGEFVFSVTGLNHGHINGIVNGLLEAGGTLKYIYDDDKDKVNQFITNYPSVKKVNSLNDILMDEETKLVAAACITSERSKLGIKVMEAGKDYFTDKSPFTTLKQIEEVKAVIKKTKQRYFVYYSELVHVESAVYAKQLIEQGAIGRVVQVLGLGPHRLSADSRPEWFFKKKKYGGILCDIGCHNIYQFLEYANIDNAEVVHSKIANYNNPGHPELDDFGDATMIGEDGSTHYFRVDWFTPDGLNSWGDGRLTILGTDGYIELRKYLDVGKSAIGDNVILVNHEGESFMNVNGKVGFPFFGELILDSLNRTDNAQTQYRALKASELSIIAQNNAIKIK